MRSYDKISAIIPLPNEVYELSNLFEGQGHTLFAVGGIVRDFLISSYHNQEFQPKDIDLATEAHPEKIIEILQTSPNIKIVPKGEAFGVISAIINNQEYEIATFREDGEYSDGRRPDCVNFSTPEKDAQRRDLTCNALFYDIHLEEIRDYNLGEDGQGLGFQDIQQLKTRPVGNAYNRFREDQLRIPRLIRFFSRFNSGAILEHLEEETLNAIYEFKNLHGVSPERIAMEFMTGLKKSLNSVKYIQNYESLGLLPNIFPNLNISLENLENIQNIKNIKAIFAWIFRNNKPSKIQQQLNQLKYSNEISDRVSFLVKLFQFNISNVFQLLRQRDLYLQLENLEIRESTRQILEEDIRDFAVISGLGKEFNFFINYQPKTNSQNYRHLENKQIGMAMKQDEATYYGEEYAKNNY